jgi:hypothetical protein
MPALNPTMALRDPPFRCSSEPHRGFFRAIGSNSSHWRCNASRGALRALPDLDGRANLVWLPSLGPHAHMHERFAVTLSAHLARSWHCTWWPLGRSALRRRPPFAQRFALIFDCFSLTQQLGQPGRSRCAMECFQGIAARTFAE